MKKHSYLVAALALTFVQSVSAAINPQEIYERSIEPLQARIATAKNIAKPTEANMAIISGCFMATQIYLKNMLPSIGEKKLTSIGMPGNDEAEAALDNVVSVVRKQQSTYRNEDGYMSKLEPFNVEFRKYFFDNVGNNQIRANNRRVGAWVIGCRGVTNPSNQN